jgi:hypothetical protein
MLKALNDLFIFIIYKLRQRLRSSHLTKVSFGIAIIMNTCKHRNVKITAIDNDT